MNNTTIINIFESDNSNIAYINNLHCQIMTTIAYRILKFESIIKKPVMANYTSFAVVTSSKINSFAYISSIVIKRLSNLQKYFHQDILAFACLHFYKHNCLNILEGNIGCRMQVKNQ